MADVNDALQSALEDRVRFEALIADISSQFVNLDLARLDEVITDAQRRIVDALHVDRSLLIQMFASRNSCG